MFACLSITCLSTFIIHLFVSSDNPLIRIFFNHCTTEYSYGGNDNVTKVILSGGGTVIYTYDNGDRVIMKCYEEKIDNLWIVEDLLYDK